MSLSLWYIQGFLAGFGMLVFFTHLSLMEILVRYLVLFCLFSVDNFKWFCMGILHKSIQFMCWGSASSILGLPLFLLYINDLPDMMMNCFCGMVDRRKVFMPYFQPGPLSEILTIANLWHAISRVWTCTESEFRFCWMKLCSSDNHYTMVPRCHVVISNIAIYTNDTLYSKSGQTSNLW